MLMMLMMSFANEEHTFVGTQIEFEVRFENPDEIGNLKPRTPVIIPTIYFDGTTLYFATPCDGYTLYITDVEGSICYETVVPYGAEELTLPKYLSGEYEIRLSNGACDFVGSIFIN